MNVLKVGDQITAAGFLDGGVRLCLVSKIHDKHPDIFLAYPAALGVIDHDNLTAAARWYGPHEEHVRWANGWDTSDAQSLRALAALDSSR